MIIVLGKSYSHETQRVINYFKQKKIDFNWIDLELDREGGEDYRHWMKANKIIGLPVVIANDKFVVGDDVELIEKLLKLKSAD